MVKVDSGYRYRDYLAEDVDAHSGGKGIKEQAGEEDLVISSDLQAVFSPISLLAPSRVPLQILQI